MGNATIYGGGLSTAYFLPTAKRVTSYLSDEFLAMER